MIRFRSVGGFSLFSLSGTRLTQLDNNRKNAKPLRFVLLKELKAVLDGASTHDQLTPHASEFGPVTVTPSKKYTFNAKTDSGLNTEVFTVRRRLNVSSAKLVDLSIGCVGFTKTNTNKILRAAGIQPAKKAKALSAAAGR